MKYTYNNGLETAGRYPKLWIVFHGLIYKFEGSVIEGLLAIISTKYEKSGKWSNTTYELELAEGAVPCHMLAPMHGQVWPENDRMLAYERFMRQFKVTLSFQAFDEALARDYPKSRERMLEGEKALESLDSSSGIGDSELVEITTSQSCRRNPHSDVLITATDGRTWVVAHEADRGIEIPGVCKLVDVKYSPGYRGGSTTLIFAITAGVTVEGQYYPKDGEVCDWALGRNGDGTPNSSNSGETQESGGTAMGDGLRRAGLR